MSVRVRSARSEDLPSIIPWTTKTFPWGDYVPDRLPDWIADDESEVLVCVDDDDEVLAMTHAIMVSPTEGWLEAARVHPDHRRAGLGKTLNDAGVSWIAEQGGVVVRLATEDDNEPAIRQVEGLGYRHTSSWVYASWAPEEVKGGRQRPGLTRASGQDVDAAWVFWSTSDLAQAARGLVSEGWRWRKAHADDLTAAAAEGELFHSPSGWAAIKEFAADPGYLRPDWVATTSRDFPGLLDEVMDLAAGRGLGLDLRLPELPWIEECFRRAGADPSGILVFTRPI